MYATKRRLELKYDMTPNRKHRRAIEKQYRHNMKQLSKHDWEEKKKRRAIQKRLDNERD